MTHETNELSLLWSLIFKKHIEFVVYINIFSKYILDYFIMKKHVIINILNKIQFLYVCWIKFHFYCCPLLNLKSLSFYTISCRLKSPKTSCLYPTFPYSFLASQTVHSKTWAPPPCNQIEHPTIIHKIKNHHNSIILLTSSPLSPKPRPQVHSLHKL